MRAKQVLYLMSNPFKLFKIGISKNPIKRCRQIELASGSPVAIIKCWQTLDAPAFEVEQYLHRLFARKRKQGEWFDNITISDIEYAGYDLTECNHNGTLRRK
jgi:hypothetical protein